MRTVLMSLVLLSTPAFADDGELPYPKARGMRNAGIALSIPGIGLGALGTGLLVGGAISASNTVCDEGRPDCNTGNIFQMVGGGLSLAVATPFLATGLPLWVTGNKRMKANQAPRVQAQLVFGPSRDGARLSVVGRF